MDFKIISFIAILLAILYISINVYEFYAGNINVSAVNTLLPITNPPYQYNCAYGVPNYIDWCMLG